MKSAIKTIAIVLMFVLTCIPLTAVEVDAATTTVERTGFCTTGDFSDNGGGWLKITIANSGTDDTDLKIVVYEAHTENKKADKSVTLAKESEETYQLNFSYDSSGVKYVDVLVYEVADGTETLIEPASEHDVKIDVEHSVWKKASTYVVIVVVVIVIIVVLIIVLRTAKKTKADTAVEDRAFTQMREEKLAKKSGKAPAAEKQTYVSSGNKKRKSN